MKSGEEVICIDISPNRVTGHNPCLTIDKMYIIDSMEYDSYNDCYIIHVYNDENVLYGYNDCRFADLVTYRRMKLQKLGNISDE